MPPPHKMFSSSPNNATFNQSSSSEAGYSSLFWQTSNLSTSPFTFPPSTPVGSEDPFASSTRGSLFGGSSVGLSGTASSQTSSTFTFGATPSSASGSSSSSSFAFNIGSGLSEGSTSAYNGGKGCCYTLPSTSSALRVFTSKLPFSSWDANSVPSNSGFGFSSAPASGASGTTSFGLSSTTISGSGFVQIPPFGQSTSSSGTSQLPNLLSGGWRPVKHTNWFVPPAPISSDLGTEWCSTHSTSQCLNPLQTSSTSNSIFSTPAVALSCNSAGVTQSIFGGELGGTRVAGYAAISEGDIRTGLPAYGKIDSIAAMPIYNSKSHEELRLEDYKSGDKGRPRPVNQLSGGFNVVSSNTLANPFSPLGAPRNPPVNHVFPSTHSDFFTSMRTASCTSETQVSGPTLPAVCPSPFSSSSPYTTSAPQLQLFSFSGTGASTPVYSLSSSGGPSFAYPFWTASSASATVSDPVHEPNISLSTDPYSSAAYAPSSCSFTGAAATSCGSISGFSCFSSQPSPVLPSSIPGRCDSFFKQSAPPTHPNMSRVPSTEDGFSQNIFSSIPCPTKKSAGFSQTEAAFVASPPTLTADHRDAVSAGASIQSLAGSNDFGVANQIGVQNINLQKSSNTTAEVVQSSTVSSPSVVQLPIQISVDSPCCTLSIQCGISSIRVPYFCNEAKARLSKVDDAFNSKQNPQGWTCHSTKVFPCQDIANKSSGLGNTFIHVYENGSSGKTSSDNVSKNFSVRPNLKTSDNYPMPKGWLCVTVKRHGDGEISIDVGHTACVTALMPKIQNADYYTKPPIEELAARERAEPGFCGHVKDFVVGRKGYGSIKFLEETDVRELDIESVIQFNYKEVTVYLDESKKPPIGQGLNKPAEITLLNVKCINKSTGKQYTDGPHVEKYREMLKDKAAELHAEMISYDPVQGEWKFRVQHF